MSIHKDGFIPYTTKGFTFGFEIEGAFHKRLMDTLEDSLESGGEFKQDGSVSFHNIPLDREDMAFFKVDSRQYHASEYASPIFDNIDELIEELKLFGEGNYYSNKSCGIHLHIGFNQRHVLANKFRTQAILEQLQKQFLPLVCKCVKQRIDEGSWCKLHTYFKDGRAETNDKYKAVNFHHQGTIELRLFAPCKHLISNIQKVLTEFFRVGYRDYNGESQPITCIFEEGKKIEIIETITPEKKSYDYGFNQNQEYPISPLARFEDWNEFDRLQRELTVSGVLHENLAI